jgi:ferredoxin
MGVKFNESPEDAECISCLKCMDKACKFNAISLEIAGLPVGRNGRIRSIPATKQSNAAR